jgi:DNA-binding NtrC family response regulator
VPALMTLEKRRLHGAVRPTVVIADGDSLYRWFVSEALATRDMHVVQCCTVLDAAAFLHRRPGADLLIVDAQTLRDEGGSAMDTLERASRSLPCLLLDSSGHEPHVASAGAIVVVDKPVDTTALIALVDQQLRDVTEATRNALVSDW